jgi:hypothetical protein
MVSNGSPQSKITFIADIKYKTHHIYQVVLKYVGGRPMASY